MTIKNMIIHKIFIEQLLKKTTKQCTLNLDISDCMIYIFFSYQ